MSLRVLDFDLGNTRIKWRYSSAGRAIDEGALAHEGLGPHALPVGTASLDRIRIASVVQGERLEALVGLCRTHWQIEPEIARVLDHCAGVRQGYTDKTRLGVDRWLALLAAYNAAGEACVLVSCGTAITVDLVTRDGEHLGGYIAPGLELMRRALFSGTGAVKLDRIEPPDSLAPARDTLPAVSRGLILMVKGLVDNAVAELRSRGELPEIILTGGDGELMIPFLIVADSSTKARYRPNLVLDGLSLALP